MEEINYNAALDEVSSYVYLGTVISNDSKLDKKIQNGGSTANQLYFTINNLNKKKRNLSKRKIEEREKKP